MVQYEFKLNYKRELWYKLLCYYNAKTELYDRKLTDIRSPYDKTEAYIITPKQRELSNKYSINLRKNIIQITDDLMIPNDYIKFNNNRNYSAQRWIDEYELFNNNGEYDGLIGGERWKQN